MNMNTTTSTTAPHKATTSTATVAVLTPATGLRMAHLPGPSITLDQIRGLDPQLTAISTYTLIGSVHHHIDLWADDEALLAGDPQLNLTATILADTPLYGAIAATGGNQDTGDTTGLTGTQTQWINAAHVTALLTQHP